MEFITIGGGEYYVDIFNGVAAIVKSGDYLSIFKIAATIAFSMALLNAAISNSLYDTGKWFITTFIITQVLLYPKTSIHVTDKTNPTLMGAQIDNVPFVIGYTASASSQVGYSMTKLFETVFSLPDDLQYSENGMIFGVNLMKAMMQAKITNSQLASSVDSFTKNCIFFDLQFGIYSFEDFKNADDIWQFVKDTQVENRFFTYTASDNSVSYPSCKDGSQKLNADWNKEFLSPNNLGFFAKKPNLTQTLLSSAAPDVNQYFLNVSKSSQQILQQAMMMNAINDAVESNEAESDVQLYQNTRAALQTKSTYQTIGAQAGVWVPILKIIIESIYIAAFPIVILLCLLPNLAGSVLRGYLGTFLWLASWGPMYAILHRIAMGHGKTYAVGFDGLTLYTQAGLEQSMSDIAAMAGYMSIFVPMLAMGIARGGVAAMSSMTTSFMSGVQSAAGAAAHEGTTGNLSFGNVGIGSRSVSSGSSIMNDAGQVTHRNNDGSSAIDNSRAESRLGFELRGSQRIENSLSNAISQEQTLAHTKSVQAQQLAAHGFEKAIANHRAIESSQGFEQNSSASEKGMFSRVDNASIDFAKERNISREMSEEIFGNIGLNLSASIGGKTGPVNVGGAAGLEAGARLVGRDSDSNLYKEAESYIQARHLSKDFEAIKSAAESNRFNITDSNGESLNENFSKSKNLLEESEIHRENAQRLSEQQQQIKSRSFEVDQNYSNEYVHYLKDKYGSIQAVLDITNPNHLDKSARNQEIEAFAAIKEKEILGDLAKPNFDNQYKNEASALKHQQSALNNTYKFSNGTTPVNNSSLQHSVTDKFDKTEQIISEQKIDNAVVAKVKKEQDEGL